MADSENVIQKARYAVSERADLPGMSLMEHLDELRKRIVHSAIFISLRASSSPGSSTIASSSCFQPRSIHMHKTLMFTHPMDALNLYLQVCADGGRYPGLALHSLPGLALHRPWALSKRAPLRGPLHGGHGGPVPRRRKLRVLSSFCPAPSRSSLSSSGTTSRP